ncbi:MAG: hypothetical protein WCW35_07660 [Bacteroidota bacterium]
MKTNKFTSLLMTAAVAGMLSGSVASAQDKAPTKSTDKKEAKKDGCSGKDGCKGKDMKKGKDGCSGKDGCKGKDMKKGKDGCSGKDGCKGHDEKKSEMNDETKKDEKKPN